MVLDRLGIFCILPFMTLAGPASAACEDDWYLYIESEKDEISICYRDLDDGSGLIEFRGETAVRSSLSSLVELLHDVDSMHLWVAQVTSAEVLEEISESERYLYFTLGSPFIGFDDRDTIVHTIVSQDSESRTVTIAGDVIPGYMDERRDHVRIQKAGSKWVLIPRGDGNVRVLFQGYASPGGPLEGFIVTFFMKSYLWALPYRTLKNMRKYLGENMDSYTGETFSFIEEAD